jgi:hypothetical protein
MDLDKILGPVDRWGEQVGAFGHGEDLPERGVASAFP